LNPHLTKTRARRIVRMMGRLSAPKRMTRKMAVKMKNSSQLVISTYNIDFLHTMLPIAPSFLNSTFGRVG
jgi:hypothetical protein